MNAGNPSQHRQLDSTTNPNCNSPRNQAFRFLSTPPTRQFSLSHKLEATKSQSSPIFIADCLPTLKGIVRSICGALAGRICHPFIALTLPPILPACNPTNLPCACDTSSSFETPIFSSLHSSIFFFQQFEAIAHDCFIEILFRDDDQSRTIFSHGSFVQKRALFVLHSRRGISSKLNRPPA